MECLGEEVEEKWGRCEAKRETAFDVGGILPLEGKQMLVIRGNGDNSKGVLDIPLDDYATWASLYDLLVDVVDYHVFDS
jgi:hypothetical protein